MSAVFREGAFAATLDAKRLLTMVGDRIENAAAHLKFCKVEFDAATFKRISECLDDAYRALDPAILAQLDAMDKAQQAREGKSK